MSRNEAGMLAMSMSGHDRGQVYVILKEDEDYVYLSDGKRRPVERCKKKNRRHIQIIRHQEPEIAQKLATGETVRNEEIKRAIRLYEQAHRSE